MFEDVAGIEAVRRKRLAQANRAIGETASHINAATARLFEELATFIEDDGWHDDGAKTPEEWVGWRLGVTPSDARHHVRIAQRLRELPLISESFGRGELSYWQVRVIVPVASAAVESELLNMARYSTPGQLQRLIGAYKSCLDRAELETSNDAHRQRSLIYYFDSDGFLNLRGRMTADEGAVLVSALRAAEDALWDELPEGDRPAPEQIRADALGQVARAALAAPHGGGAALPSVVVHADVPSLSPGSETAVRLRMDLRSRRRQPAGWHVIAWCTACSRVTMRSEISDAPNEWFLPGCASP